MSFNKERLERKFAEEYNKLNERQRLAVDSIEGPVMVIAGPGTGKTQILASRIGKILLETDAYPQNILCLTYTDAGVVAMRKRLLQFIGPDAYKVNIYTFHAFCNEIIQENLFLFEKAALDPVSDLEKIELFKELIDSFPKNHPLKRYRGDVYFEIHNLDKLFSTMKREGWSPSFILQKIDEHISDLTNREEFIYKRKYKEFSVGDLKNERIEEEKEKMERLKAAVNEFDRFQQMMRKRNRYDFDDMINWVIKAFQENKNLLASYQERFLYTLVDEYQDTSGTQNRIVELLINYWEKPNVFVVGDDDQSIYRFQGANVENMLAFAETYKSDLLKVVLVNNYRSTQSILDISKTLIDKNNKRLINKIEGLSKELISSNSQINHLIHKPIIRSYDTQRQEMIDIALQIEKLIAQDVPANRIGVIYRENRYGDDLVQYFKLRKIPYYSKRSLNILEIPLAQKIILLLKYLVAEHDIPYSGDEMLFEILHFDWFYIPSIEIAKLTIEASNKKYDDSTHSLRRLLHEKKIAPPKDLFSQGLHEGLKNASVVLEQLISDVPNITLQMLFENIIRKAGILNFIMKSQEKIWHLQVLTALFDFIKEETARKPLMQLKDLVSIIELMEKEDLALPLTEICGNDKGVNLMTAHGSKGLEFEYVFFAGCNATFWEKKRKPYNGYKLPDTIFSVSHLAAGQGEIEELRRLFYVALTRAEQHLIISYCCYKNDGKELEPSVFIEEILDQQQLAVEKIFIDENVLAEFSALQFGEAIAPEIEEMEKEFMNRLLEKFVMNVTALNNYLKCPLEFYFKNLIRIPSPKNEATEFGSSVHYAVEQLFRKMQSNNEQFPSKEEFIKDFEWYMHRHRESFTKEQFERRLEYGHDVLSNYYDKYINSWNKIVTIERNIRNILVNDVPLKGKMDKLEFDGKSVNVVDYKTGDPDKAKIKLQPPSEKDPVGGDYWRQAVFYKILVDNYEQKGWKVASTEFDFVEPDKKKVYKKEKIVITPQDIDLVCEQIKTVWEKIQNHDFYIGCGKEDCHWCNFVKTNNLTVALSEENQD
ncbi:MAG TPA: ATP-dependent DNA helicase [Chitinophagaceae bacterium]|jgi:DNA helicase-2/ATP-dependent DNA helicase PcrA|nr:ATP-dependent DNA helicase [Chitinophagaceae bacterium]